MPLAADAEESAAKWGYTTTDARKVRHRMMATKENPAVLERHNTILEQAPDRRHVACRPAEAALGCVAVSYLRQMRFRVIVTSSEY
jgi:hypothetical protein